MNSSTKIQLKAATRLLAAEKDPREEALKRRLERQQEKEDKTAVEKKALIDTQEQLKRARERSKRRKELEKPAAERRPVGVER